MTTRRLAVFFLLIGSLRAGTVQEIEKGLTYARISDLDKDTAQLESVLGRTAVIFDLRNAVGTPEAARNFALRLAQPSKEITDHRIFLINPGTASEVIQAAELSLPRQITIGPRAPNLHADIEVATSVDADRRAFEAFATGAALSKLANSNPEKKRYDEATLARNRSAVLADPDAAAEEPDALSPASPPAPAPAENAIHDLVLERAIQLHHALQLTMASTGK